MPTPQRLFLIDGSAIAYRSYYAFIQRPLINSKGQNTSAIYGFVTFLNSILQKEKPDYIAVVFDTAAPTFRHETYKEYKATRQKMPEDLVPQIGTIKEVVRAYNIPVLELDGFEADDIMGTLARRAEREGVETYLVTSDKDFMQLVSKKIRMYKPGRSGDEVEVIDTEGVKKKFGVAPDRVIDVLSLIGDSSDNVPGVPGVGEKTAIPLIQRFGTIEALYEQIDKIEQKGVRQKLESNREKAFLSKQLVTIDTNAPIEIDFHRLKAGPKDLHRLRTWFRELEFKSLLSSLEKELPTQPIELLPNLPSPSLSQAKDIRSDQHTYKLITTGNELAQLISILKKAKEIVIDTETTSTDAMRADLVGISFSPRPTEAFFVSIKAPTKSESRELFGDSAAAHGEIRGIDLPVALEKLRPILEDRSIQKIGHNIKYDLLVLAQHGVWVEGIGFDTMIASYILRADGRHSLDAAALEHLNYKMVSYTELTGTGKQQKSLREVRLEDLADYSCEDADMTFRLYEAIVPRLRELNLLTLCEEMEFPLIDVLARMEHTGVCIDTAYLQEMSKELERMLDTLVRDIHNFAGTPFNINSTQQLGDVLFNKLKLRTVKKTKTGYSTDVSVLEELRHEHPIVEKLLEYRQLAKLKSTYVDALPALIHPRTGRVHTSYNQTIAATGRLSSSDPNLQNIPIRTELGRSIRRAFIPGSSDHLILSADYSQIELRVMAHISGDEGLAEAFRQGEDVHATTAAKIFGVAPMDVTKDMRRKAKEVNFGIMYGIGPFGLANRLEISQTEAKEIIAKYFDRFPKVRQYIHDTIETARERGYVETLCGRRRYLPDLQSRNQTLRANAERQAINMPIQGTAADMIKLAMIRIDKALRSQKLNSSMILQVHDELVFEMRKSEEKSVRTLVSENMREALPLSVPIVVEMGVGKNWLEAH